MHRALATGLNSPPVMSTHDRLKARIRKVGPDQARQEMVEPIEQLRGTDGGSELASHLRDLAELERWQSDHAASISAYEEAVAVLRELDEPLQLGHTLRHLGQVCQESGHILQAEACCAEALALYREFGAGEPLQIANSVRYLAVAKDEAGKAEVAAELWREALDRYESLQLHAGVAECAARLATLSSLRADSNTTLEWLGRAEAAAEASGDWETVAYVSGLRNELS